MKPIVSVSNDTWQNARRGVWVCPFCEFDARDDVEVWDRNATKLILEPKMWKPGCLAYFSECPKCFEQSWVHIELRSFRFGHEELPAEWRKKGRELYNREMAKAQRQLKASLCNGCKLLDKIKIDYCYPISDCKYHHGHALTKREGCKYFKPAVAV